MTMVFKGPRFGLVPPSRHKSAVPSPSKSPATICVPGVECYGKGDHDDGETDAGTRQYCQCLDNVGVLALFVGNSEPIS